MNTYDVLTHIIDGLSNVRKTIGNAKQWEKLKDINEDTSYRKLYDILPWEANKIMDKHVKKVEEDSYTSGKEQGREEMKSEIEDIKI